MRRWTPPYTLNGFLALEEHIASSGAQQWLTFEEKFEEGFQDEQHIPRRGNIVGGFKTIPRRALLATRSADNQVRVEEVHGCMGISLFVFEEYRRKGFALKMVEESTKVVQAYSAAQNQEARFFGFFSYVGKVFSCEAKVLLR